jgi:hypothetical protein
MKHISILVPNDSVLASIVDARTMFTGANEFLEAADKEPLFNIQLVGLSKEVPSMTVCLRFVLTRYWKM